MNGDVLLSDGTTQLGVHPIRPENESAASKWVRRLQCLRKMDRVPVVKKIVRKIFNKISFKIRHVVDDVVPGVRCRRETILAKREYLSCVNRYQDFCRNKV